MNELWLKITLLSDGCFSRGDGLPGVVDIEVNHDAYGFPFLGGRTLKGLLHAEAAVLIAALQKALLPDQFQRWAKVSNALFGEPGSRMEQEGKLHLTDAQLAADLRQSVMASMGQANRPDPYPVLSTLTTIRRQTALDESGAPRHDTLRSVRVILRDLTFLSCLTSLGDDFSKDEMAFLAACIHALRRVGSQKTRGYGRVQAVLHTAGGQDSPLPKEHFERFKEAVL